MDQDHFPMRDNFATNLVNISDKPGFINSLLIEIRNLVRTFAPYPSTKFQIVQQSGPKLQERIFMEMFPNLEEWMADCGVPLQRDGDRQVDRPCSTNQLSSFSRILKNNFGGFSYEDFVQKNVSNCLTGISGSVTRRH